MNLFEGNFIDGVAPMVIFAFAASATPGPVNVISAMSGARFGPVRCIPYVLGATSSFVGILLLVGLGLGALISGVRAASVFLTVVGSGYMLYIAYKIARDRGEIVGDDGAATPPGFVSGLIVQGVNPKAWLVSLSAVTVYVAHQAHYRASLLIFAAIFFVVCALSVWGWSLIGHRAAQFSGSIAIFNRIMAALLFLSVGYILLGVL